MSFVADAQARYERAQTYLHEDLWAHEHYDHASRRRRAAIYVLRTVYLVVAGFQRERLKLRAAALTYLTLLAMVPAMAVGLSLFKAFGGLQDSAGRLKEYVIDFVSATHQDVVTAYLDRFVSSVHAGAVGGIGIFFLLFTALSLVADIEKAFNDIWGVRKDRSLLRRFQAYFPLLTLGPIAIGISMTLTATMEASKAAHRIEHVIPVSALTGWLTPVVLTWAGFTMLYVIIPNVRVPFRYCLVGGIVAGSMWELAKHLYALYAAKAISYSAIYGSLGAIPLFIIWIYVSWLVALIGATLTFAIQNAHTYQPDKDVEERLSPREREALAARLLYAAYQRYEAGGGAFPAEELVATVEGPPRRLAELLEELEDGGLLIRTARELKETEGEAYVPGKPPAGVTLADVLRVVRGAHDAAAVTGADAKVEKLLSEAETATQSRLSAISFEQLLVG